MIYDILTYGILASVFVVQTLRMFVEKPKNLAQLVDLSWQRWLKQRRHRRSL